jgi:hypothetical protein
MYSGYPLNVSIDFSNTRGIGPETVLLDNEATENSVRVKFPIVARRPLA